ncbi:MAG: MotA/TolQ/ExbB proton channel family protein [Rhodospirillaceae bacterium]|nr:MotA/TolQ/ExbB proton channel family protein [Rhodospirillaceae bacterium]
MKNSLKTVTAIAALTLGMAIAPVAFAQQAKPTAPAANPAATAAAPAAGASKSLQELLERVRQGRAEDSTVNKQREDEFRRAQADQQRLLQQAKASVASAEADGAKLEADFQKGELKLTDLQNQLQERLGSFGELFGVVRQAAGDTRGQLRNSIISAQRSGRDVVIDKLAQSKELPELKQLESMWAVLLEEAIEQGKIARFTAPVVSIDGKENNSEVVRIGPFTAVSDGKYLNYLSSTQRLAVLGRQPSAAAVSAGQDLADATSGMVDSAVDPSRGALLSLLVQTASFRERLDQGGTVGWVIMVLLVIGTLMSLERIITLSMVASKVMTQTKSRTPSGSNPLGRVLLAYQENKGRETETLQLKLDEAILKELPSLERGLSTIKVIIAIAPMLGLLGTVTGMITTFEVITLFGSGDPKMMAGGISQALVTTVQGLVTAIPLLLLHSLATGRSRAVVEILEEQSAGIVAEHMEKGK